MMSETLRQRNRPPDRSRGFGPQSTFQFAREKFKEKSLAHSRFTVLVGLTFFGVLYVVYKLDSILPTPKSMNDVSKYPEHFIEERARGHLNHLSNIGSKPTGSYENEIVAVDFLLREINFIKQRAKTSTHNIMVDVQKTGHGCFALDWCDRVTSCYANLQNIVVKLEPKVPPSHTVMVNCHFDSVPGSPGASDDGVSCAIMLEVLYILSQSRTPLKHGIIFLFNGAEENVLQASHAFITSHPWAKEVDAFINLEACGAGGKELVFQAGPRNPWLIRAYAKAAPHPFASVVGQEIFQSGIIPSDTDFRIFRDFGKIPGLDLAYVRNGYVYHTKFDSPNFITPGTVQRAGDNLLAILKYLANCSELEDISKTQQSDVVYIDFLGLFILMYSEHTGTVLNVFTAVLSLITMWNSIRQAERTSGMGRRMYMRQLMFGVVVTLISWLAALLVVISGATLLAFCRASMSWYAHPWLIAGLYVAPVLLTVTSVQHIGALRHRQYFDNPWNVEGLYYESTRLLFTMALMILTWYGVRSAFVLMLWVLLPTLARSVIGVFLWKEKRDLDWMFAYLGSQMFPMLLSSYLSLYMFCVFIPMMGRSGPEINPEMFIGIATFALTVAITAHTVCLTHALDQVKPMLLALVGVSLCSYWLVITTPLGFPYSGNPTSPTPQRYLLMHTARQFHGVGGVLKDSDSGFWFMNLDYNSPRSVSKLFPDLIPLHSKCDEHLYCGAPYYFAVLSKIRSSHWMAGPSPEIRIPTSFKLTAQALVKADVRRFTFNVSGPDHMVVILSPKPGLHLVEWELGEGTPALGIPTFQERPTYFIYLSYGAKPAVFSFWLDLKMEKHVPGEGPFLDVAVIGHLIHGREKQSPQFQNFLRQFPNWTYPLGWTATYQSYIY